MIARSISRNFPSKYSARAILYTIMALSLAAIAFVNYRPNVRLGVVLSSGPAIAVRQEERQFVLKIGCDSTRTLRPDDSLDYLLNDTDNFKHIIFNDQYKLLYCYLPKVSSTQWKKVMGVLSGKLPNIPLSKIRADSPHEKNVHQFLSDLPPDEIRRRLHNYTSFLFVRHPLERFVSGYRNKFANAALDAYFPKHFAAKIKTHYGRRKNTTQSTPASDKQTEERVTFEEFARWVSAPRPLDGARNEHWAPMVDQCHPCTIPYTVIGKMETLDEDAHHVLTTANVNTIDFPKGFHSRTGSITAEMMASLPTDLLKGVLRVYLQDFLLFGYDPSDTFVNNRTAEIFAKGMFEKVLIESLGN